MRYNVMGYNQELACQYGLSLEELLILTQMSDFFVSGNAEYKEVNGKIYYWQSYSKVIEDLPILGVKTSRTIARRMDKLEEKGMIEKYTEPRGQGSRTYFRLTDKYNSLKYKSQKLIDVNRNQNTATKQTSTRRSNQNQYDKTPFFNEFWEMYPNKKAKPTAHSAFKRKVKDEETFNLIKQDLEKRKGYEEWLKQNGKFIPHPSTYLNQERWLDEYETTNQRKPFDQVEDQVVNFDFVDYKPKD